MAGEGGFEPPIHCVKGSCLTAGLLPNKMESETGALAAEGANPLI